MALSTFLGNALLNYVLKGSAYASPSPNVYLALFTSDPGLTGASGEVSGGSYARQQVNASGWTTSTTKASENANTVAFPTASASWGTITHAALFDASSGGNMLVAGALAESKTIASGDRLEFGAGAVDFTL